MGACVYSEISALIHIYCSRESQQSEKSLEEEYPFIKRPSEDFFCPVMMGLLVQPHLTSCCGKHLSEEDTERERALSTLQVHQLEFNVEQALSS